jgi:hypothetical protein
MSRQSKTNKEETDRKRVGSSNASGSLFVLLKLYSKVLSLGNTKINLAFRSLIRTFAANKKISVDNEETAIHTLLVGSADSLQQRRFYRQ